MFKNRLFLRIYAGLIVLVVVISIFCTILVQLVNNYRLQQYRESWIDGVGFVVSESLARLSDEQREYWLDDASVLLGYPFTIKNAKEITLSYLEQRRIDQRQAVVRFDEKGVKIIIGVKNNPDRFLTMRLDAIGERQIKAISILIIDYLAAYPGQEKYYIDQLNQYFSYHLEIRPIESLNLDPEQIGRLNQDQSIFLYSDTRRNNNDIHIVVPIASDKSQVLIFGSIPVFKEMPLQLGLGMTLFGLLLLSLGVYGLILPLERKTRQVSNALDKMKTGDLSLRLTVLGDDEMSTLARSYNSMVEHIQRLIEAQRELMRAVSHELRTPVARIRFGLEMFYEEDDCEVRAMQMELIDKDIEELNQLIHEIMTYAKLEQGKPSFDFEKVILKDVLMQVFHETEALKTGKNLVLDLPLDSLQVDAEYRYLHRVVQNLVGNAIRYAETTVKISGGSDGDKAFICVEDDGAGIPEADRERIFEAFARLDDSRTRASGGYGLGLSIVGRIAYWFGGTVDVDQSPSLGGARFVMTWPLENKSSTMS